MAKNYGARKGRRGLFGVVAGVVGAIAVAAVIAQNWIQHRQEGLADYKAWIVAGPACSAPAKPGFDVAAGDHGQDMVLDGVKFSRAHGAVRCTDINEDGGRGQGTFPVCQFDRPGMISVTTRKGTSWFWAGFISPATISVQHDVPSCVIGASRDFGHTLIYDRPPK